MQGNLEAGSLVMLAAEAWAARGIAATQHGAARLTGEGFTEELYALTKSGQAFRQADGAMVYLREASPGRYDFIIEGSKGVVTAHRGWSLKSIQRIAKNYGWEWTP